MLSLNTYLFLSRDTATDLDENVPQNATHQYWVLIGHMPSFTQDSHSSNLGHVLLLSLQVIGILHILYSVLLFSLFPPHPNDTQLMFDLASGMMLLSIFSVSEDLESYRLLNFFFQTTPLHEKFLLVLSSVRIF